MEPKLKQGQPARRFLAKLEYAPITVYRDLNPPKTVQ